MTVGSVFQVCGAATAKVRLKEFSKLVIIWGSYWQEFSVLLFDSRCTTMKLLVIHVVVCNRCGVGLSQNIFGTQQVVLGWIKRLVGRVGSGYESLTHVHLCAYSATTRANKLRRRCCRYCADVWTCLYHSNRWPHVQAACFAPIALRGSGRHCYSLVAAYPYWISVELYV